MSAQHEPYLCVGPACRGDCSGCNSAISPSDMRKYAVRYYWLRERSNGAPDNTPTVYSERVAAQGLVLHGAELDAAIDVAMGGEPGSFA